MVFATYQSSPRIAEAYRLGRVPGFDLVIADEAHRCAGRVSSDFATVLDSDAIPARRRLFMTATPRFFTGRVVKEAKEADFEVASMDDESRFGPVFHRLGFAEAIERELLTDYQVVIVGVDDATYLDWAQRGRFVTIDGTKVTDARTLAGQIGLAKAMRRYDLRRTISFHSRVSGARRVRQLDAPARRLDAVATSDPRASCGRATRPVRCPQGTDRGCSTTSATLTLTNAASWRTPDASAKASTCRLSTESLSLTLAAPRSTSSRRWAAPSDWPRTRRSAPS